MLGRIKRNQNRQTKAQAAPDDASSIHGVGSLLGGSGVSLDGQSLMLPEDNTMQFGDGDEVSSIATSNFGAGGYASGKASSFRIVGPAVEEPSVPPVPQDAETGVPTSPDGESHPGMSEKVGAAAGGAAAGSGGGKGCTCMPRWLSDSPFWVKAVLIAGLALLVGAAVLVAVAAGLSSNDGSTTSSSSSNGGDPTDVLTGGTQNVTVEPTVQAAAPPTAAPTASPKPSVMPFPGQTESPTDMPSLFPSFVPTEAVTNSPTAEDTGMPSGGPTETDTLEPTEDPGPSTNVVTFYATAGRFQGEEETVVEQGLPNLPEDDGNAFMIHLGDWNSPFATSCSEESYSENVALYNVSSVPVFFIPGDNEYNDCPDPDQAMALWEENFEGFETKHANWPLPFDVDRQEPDYPENFAFLHENILFVGINLVGGTIHDADEWSARQAADLQWIDDNVEAHQGQMYYMVLFAHADPDIQSSEPFYTPFIDRVQNTYGVPVLLIHRNLGIESSGFEPNFQGVDGLVVLVVEGSFWPPMKIELNAAGSFSFDQNTWYAEEVENGDG